MSLGDCLSIQAWCDHCVTSQDPSLGSPSKHQQRPRDAISRGGGSLDDRTREASTGNLQLLKVSSYLVRL